MNNNKFELEVLENVEALSDFSDYLKGVANGVIVGAGIVALLT